MYRAEKSVIDYPVWVSGFLFFVAISYGVYFYYGLGLFNADGYVLSKDYIPTDGATYVLLAEKIDFLLESLEGWVSVLGGVLNWATIPIIYSFVNDFGYSAGLFFVFLNSVFISFSLFFLFRLFHFSRLGDVAIYATVFLASQPYLAAYILVPNKDVVVLFGISLLVFLNDKEMGEAQRVKNIFFPALFLSLFKFQFLIAYLFGFVVFLKRWRFLVLLGLISIIYPVAKIFGFGVDMDDFLATAPEDVNSAGLMIFLDQVASMPFGFLIVGPLRIFLNIFVSLGLGRFFLKEMFFIDYVSAYSGLFLSLLALFWVVKNRWAGIKEIFYIRNPSVFLFCYLTALALVPFMQTRYYWFLSPFIAGVLLTRRKWL